GSALGGFGGSVAPPEVFKLRALFFRLVLEQRLVRIAAQRGHLEAVLAHHAGRHFGQRGETRGRDRPLAFLAHTVEPVTKALERARETLRALTEAAARGERHLALDGALRAVHFVDDATRIGDGE